MGSSERSKKKVHLLPRATLHFLVCFVVGFFTGFARTGKPSMFSCHATMSLSSGYSPELVKHLHQTEGQNFNRNLFEKTETAENKSKISEDEKILSVELNPKQLIIVVKPTRKKNKLRGVLLRRLANTLKFVAQPLFWIVVVQQFDDSEVSEILRKTGIMYHIVSKENFSDVDFETDYQRNLALNNMEHHRLSGNSAFRRALECL